MKTVTGAAIEEGQPEIVSEYKIIVSLNDAQVRSLPSTPVLILPPIGVGKSIIIGKFCITRQSGYIDYTNVDATDNSFIMLVYGEGWDDDATLSFKGINALFNSQITSYVVMPGVTSGQVYPLDSQDTDNAGIYLYVNNNNLGDFQDGDVNNEFSVHVFYSIIDTPAIVS